MTGQADFPSFRTIPAHTHYPVDTGREAGDDLRLKGVRPVLVAKLRCPE